MRPKKITGKDPSGGFAYHLDFSLPFIATAIHAGHNVRKKLLALMALDSDQRRFEEDTGTDLFIQGLGNAVWGLESRAVYDLNRSRDLALPVTPERFWGTRVYKTRPSPEINRKSLQNYDAFYQFMENCIASILDQFGFCIIYDIHSYNISRQQARGIEFPPVFNLGSALLDKSRWGKAIDLWLAQLAKISLPGRTAKVAENHVFSGKAEFCRRLCRMDDRILVLPTEISKIYMDEKKGTIYPDMIRAVKNGLQSAILSHVKQVSKPDQK